MDHPHVYTTCINTHQDQLGAANYRSEGYVLRFCFEVRQPFALMVYVPWSLSSPPQNNEKLGLHLDLNSPLQSM